MQESGAAVCMFAKEGQVFRLRSQWFSNFPTLPKGKFLEKVLYQELFVTTWVAFVMIGCLGWVLFKLVTAALAL